MSTEVFETPIRVATVVLKAAWTTLVKLDALIEGMEIDVVIVEVDGVGAGVAGVGAGVAGVGVEGVGVGVAGVGVGVG